MSIGRRPTTSDTTSTSMVISDGKANLNLVAGQAVSLLEVLSVQKVVLATAANADVYLGFVKFPVAEGNNVVIMSGRGSKVAVQVEGGGSLTVNQPVYLAVTAGKVTQDISTLDGYFMLKVGVAITTTEIILKNDYAPKLA